jgi:hypothetical protein
MEHPYLPHSMNLLWHLFTFTRNMCQLPNEGCLPEVAAGNVFQALDLVLACSQNKRKTAFLVQQARYCT